MAAQGLEDVYASLLLTDTYLPGALVLAHSLRDAGTTKKLAILVTLDTVSAAVVTQLKAVYDYVIPVGRIRNDHPENLDLMNRPDLHSAFTKINLWRQAQFRKIVYVDADIVAYRAPDELFDLPHPFAAAPDIGWPDLFNTGLMVLTPNKGDYYALLAMAQRGISFDGADQGLLNMYFKTGYHRLSFTYNVTPSAHYQYLPAYKHFQSGINLVHFIGPEKPWAQGRDKATGGGPFDQMVGRWWAVYDQHYRKKTPQMEPGRQEPQVPEIIQYFVKGEFEPLTVRYVVPVGEPPSDQQIGDHYGQQNQPQDPSHVVDLRQPQQGHHHTHQSSDSPSTPQSHPHHHHQHHNSDHSHQHQHEHQHQSFDPSSHPASDPRVSSGFQEGTHTEARQDQAQQPPSEPEHKPEPQPEPVPSWDAQWHPPPADSKPEAENFPQTHYAMSSDPAQFVPPERYPSPPKNMWYEVPKEPPAQPKEKPKPVFPWETHQPRPTRVFGYHNIEPSAPAQTGPPPAERQAPTSGSDNNQHHHNHTHTWQPPPPLPGTQAHAQAEHRSTAPQPQPQSRQPQPQPGPSTPPQAPATRAAISAPAATITDIWSSFPRSNAWDNVPEINRYVDRTMPKPQRTRNRNLASGRGNNGGVIAGHGNAGGMAGNFGYGTPRRGSKVTDFPSEEDRPSLPVTPAPIRRPRRWVAGDQHGDASAGAGNDDDVARAVGGGGGGEEGDYEGGQQLQGALGVPGQADWVCVHGSVWSPADCLCELANVLRYYKDPAAQLRKLAREQSELLFQRLSVTEEGQEQQELLDSDPVQQDQAKAQGKGSSVGRRGLGPEPQREIPSRPLPFGSENAKSPTYVAPVPPTVVSPKPVKPVTGASPVSKLLAEAPEIVPSSRTGGTDRRDYATANLDLNSNPDTRPDSSNPIAAPSYQGPGLVFEKGEDFPTQETPALPTEEERDVLET